MKLAAMTALFLIVAIPPIPGQAPDKSTDKTTKPKQERNAQDQPPTQVVSPVTIQPLRAPNSQRNAGDQPKGNDPVAISTVKPFDVRVDVTKDWMDKLNWVLTAGVVCGAGFGIWYARKTLKTMREQLTEMQATGKQTDKMIAHVGVQAEAALLNAQAIINAERPWIVVSVEPQEHGMFAMMAKNAGRTPARVTAIWSDRQIVKRGEEFRFPPGYESGESLFGYLPCFLPPGASIGILRFQIEGIENDFSGRYYFGRILYSDVLRTGPEVKLETRWFYWHIPAGDRLPIPDPHHPEYNTYT